MTENQDTVELSCGHIFHHRCFFQYALQTFGHVLISCPLCRETNRKFPEVAGGPEKNIEFLTGGNKRCCHTTKAGKICKNRCVPFNYGCCRTHHRSVIPREKLSEYYEYLKYILITANNWKTKVYMMDMSKQLLIKNPEKTAMDLHLYFLLYYHSVKNMDREDREKTRDATEAYEFLELTYPPKRWADDCIQKRVIG
jgi:hypothetical protein